MAKITKAIIPVAGLGTRFLPLSKIVPKELWPLVDKPVIQYILEEAKDSGIKEIIFVEKPGDRLIDEYFKKTAVSEKILKAKYKSHFAAELKNLENISKSISFLKVIQKEPFGAAHAVLQAQKIVGNEPCAVLWADDVVEAKTPSLLQLIKVFEKYHKPAVALCRIPKESFHFYGMVKGRKTENRVYKISEIIEKPSAGQSPSNLAIVGKHIITPKVFDYLKNTRFGLATDISLTLTLDKMAREGEEIYGCELEGKWLECGNKLAYLKSNFYLALKHPQFGRELNDFLRAWQD